MLSLAPAIATGLTVLQMSSRTSQAEWYKDFSFFTSTNAGGRGVIAQIFLENDDLMSAFGTAYAKAITELTGFATKSGFSGEGQAHTAQYNAAHIALVETIMANRERFPEEGFAIHTELGDGASITTYITPIGEDPELALEKWYSENYPGWRRSRDVMESARAAMARAAADVALQEQESRDRSTLASREHVEELYRAS